MLQATIGNDNSKVKNKGRKFVDLWDEQGKRDRREQCDGHDKRYRQEGCDGLVK